MVEQFESPSNTPSLTPLPTGLLYNFLWLSPPHSYTSSSLTASGYAFPFFAIIQQ